jgi:hypothetical protein
MSSEKGGKNRNDKNNFAFFGGIFHALFFKNIDCVPKKIIHKSTKRIVIDSTEFIQLC